MAWNIDQSEESIENIDQSETSIDNINQSEFSILPGGPPRQSSRHLVPPLAAEVVTGIIILFTSFYHFINKFCQDLFFLLPDKSQKSIHQKGDKVLTRNKIGVVHSTAAEMSKTNSFWIN